MRLIEYLDAQAFHRDVGDALAAHEVVNNLPLGILIRGVNGEALPDWFMARVESPEDPCELIALMTPPRNLLLAARDRSVPLGALELLAEHLWKNRIVPPGVVAEEALSQAFARAFAAQSSASYEIATSERLYRLDRVEDVPVTGSLRLAQARDMHYLPFWMKAFADECFHVNSPLDADTARWCIDRGATYILEDEGLPVSMAGSSRQMPRGRAIGPVYTPPYLRSHGFATASVALLSRIILEKGNDYCALFTDLSNPISNSIYQKIGYRPVADFAEIRFV
jgi:predicted GNAT family acetyltransferase